MKKKTQKLHVSDVLTAFMYTVIFVGALCCLFSCTTPKAVNKSAAHYYIITCSNDTIPNR